MSGLGIEILGKQPGNWKVLLSQKAVKSIQSVGRSEPIVRQLRDLASGSWSCRIVGTEKQRDRLRVPLAATRCTPNNLILWQVDVAFDDAIQADKQLVKIWDVGTKSQILGLVDHVIRLQELYTTEHVKRCRQRAELDGDKKVIPTIFTNSEDAIEPGARAEVLDIRTADREVLQMANRFYALTEPMLRSVLAQDLLAEFPFDFSSEETRTILHIDTSSLILGRSGTGKTTCLVFKLLAKYAAASNVDRERLPRQLLLTRSDELANKLKDYISRLMRTLVASSPSEGEDQEGEFPSLGAKDEEDNFDTLFELSDGSFPFVCTFDGFLELLENTIRSLDREGFPVNDHDDEASDHEASENDTSDRSARSEGSQDENLIWHLSGIGKINRFVDFQSFKLDYWPRFSAALTAKVPVELAFAEILGVIKGSLSSKETLQPLSRYQYLQLGSRSAPTFALERERSQIYDIFERYEAMKFERSDSDGVDRVAKVIGAIRNNQRLKDWLGASFDEVYIDEVQDLRCLEIELLLSMVKDSRAFHFAGDTAQTISHDSHFRFQDIKALFYSHFVQEAEFANQPGLARPQLFTLARNYRSHQGTLGLASLVMQILWDRFPETVDKLDPEIGHIYGPLPVFFLGCKPQMLAWSDPDSANLPKQSLDFGAEQVIIVRDPDTKAHLQAELGDRALVLTVLQSKGMEFDDVFLWNFFTESPCAGGWRCLKTKPESVNAAKHAGMCSELKQLYVAITRSRLRLSIIESAEPLAAQVAEFLNQEASPPLVEVARSSDQDFLEELISLRSVSYDPARWSDRGQELMQRKQYRDAAICFRRAKDKRGETHADACLAEESGRRQTQLALARQSFQRAVKMFIKLDLTVDAVRNLERLGEFERAAELWSQKGNLRKAAPLYEKAGQHQKQIGLARQLLQRAVDIFVELDLTADAVRNLERMDEFEKAAELWFQKGKFRKAAPLYDKASSYNKAADCYHRGSEYDKAAGALRSGSLTDQLLAYLCENRQKLSSNAYRSHSHFYILLLKQDRLPSKSYEQVISLLGDVEEQERSFIRFGMHEQLKSLYNEQRNTRKLFFLHFKAGELGEALKALRYAVPTGLDDSLLPTVQRACDYFFAGAIASNREHDQGILNIVRKLSFGPTQVRIQRVPEWETANSVIKDRTMFEENGLVKNFLALHFLLSGHWLSEIKQFKDISFRGLLAMIDITKTLSSLAEGGENIPTLLFTGVLEINRGTNHWILLPWSPLQAAITVPNARKEEYPRVATQWLLERVGSFILDLDLSLRDLWRVEWPVRCANYLTSSSGFCWKFKEGTCLYRHKRLSCADCTEMTSLLLKINAVFCGSSVLYFKRALGQRFQSNFLSVRRYWLESLVHELTFISSVQRSSQVIVKAQSDILPVHSSQETHHLEVVASHIEDLLFHRLGREWQERSGLSSIFEQIQLSQMFDSRVQARFNRALFYKLRNTPNSQFQCRMVRGLQSLEGEIANPNTASFSANLNVFLDGLAHADHRHLTSFHALTTVFEFFALYLILRIRPTILVIPQSWIDIHLSWFVRNGQLLFPQASPKSSIQTYGQCLIDLTRRFTTTISRLQAPTFEGFRQGIRAYPFRLLHLRNVEFLSVAIVNLHATSLHLPRLTQVYAEVSKAFETGFGRADHLQHKNIPELVTKLASSYSIYENKDAIKLVKTSGQRHYFEDLLRRSGVQTLSLDSVLSTMSNSRVPAHDTTEEYCDKHFQAVCKIQRFWRYMSILVQTERDLMRTRQGRLAIQFKAACRQYSASKHMRDLLMSKKLLKLYEIQHSQSIAAEQIGERAVELFTTLPESQLEAVGGIIDRNNDKMQALSRVATSLMVDRPEDLAQQETTEVEKRFADASDELQIVERKLKEDTKLLETISRTDQEQSRVVTSK